MSPAGPERVRLGRCLDRGRRHRPSLPARLLARRAQRSHDRLRPGRLRHLPHPDMALGPGWWASRRPRAARCDDDDGSYGALAWPARRATCGRPPMCSGGGGCRPRTTDQLALPVWFDAAGGGEERVWAATLEAATGQRWESLQGSCLGATTISIVSRCAAGSQRPRSCLARPGWTPASGRRSRTSKGSVSSIGRYGRTVPIR